MKKFAPKKILVPVDFSAYSLHALRTAREIAGLRGAEVVVLHVMKEPPPPSASGSPSVVYANWEQTSKEIEKEAAHELEAMASEAGCRDNTRRVSVWGDPANEVTRVAGEGGFDLIVMSTHGRTGLSRLVMGSVAEKVIRQAPCPVFVLRASEG